MEQTKDYLIIIKQDYDIIEMRFRALTEELYNDFFKDYDCNYDEDKSIFEYDKVIKNFTWENYKAYLKKRPQEYNLNDMISGNLSKLLSFFEPEIIIGHYYDYFGKKCCFEEDYDEKAVKEAIETIIKALKNIKNTRTYEYICK